MDEELFDPSCSACERAQEDFAKQDQRIADLERELAEQARLNGMGSEREAALMAKVERLERERNGMGETHLQQLIELDELREQLAAAQATIAAKDEALRKCAAGVASGAVQVAATEALALPADRTALDAMLAEARLEERTRAAGIADKWGGTLVAEEMRQAAERGE